jgi:glutathione S-transferase
LPPEWLEEVGLPYEVRLVSFRAMKELGHRALHPFGQIPTHEEGRHKGLLADDANVRARAITWMFAARNTVDPPRNVTLKRRLEHRPRECSNLISGCSN